jgi:hypothetical protein
MKDKTNAARQRRYVEKLRSRAAATEEKARVAIIAALVMRVTS